MELDAYMIIGRAEGMNSRLSIVEGCQDTLTFN